MACTVCKERNYITKKNRRNDPDRMELKKYCPRCKKHTPHRETRGPRGRMPLAPDLAGREFPPTPPYDVSRSQIAAFADAIGADDPLHRDPEAAKAAGHPDVIAPPTFPIVVAFQAMT